MCLLPVTDHPTHRRTDKPSYRDAWTLDTSKNEWRWGYFINIKQKNEDNTETLFTAKILAQTSIFEGFYARYRATSINRGWIWSDMHGQIMLQMACIESLHEKYARCAHYTVHYSKCTQNAHSGPGSSCITHGYTMRGIPSSYVILMPIFGFLTIELVYEAIEACGQQ